MTNYMSKGTQEDDSESYKRVAATVKRRFNHHMHEIDRSEALSRLMSCVYAQTRAHIISAPLARFLIKTDSRFIFSHDFTFIPLQNFNKYVMNKTFTANLRVGKSFATVTSKILDYIYRSKDLEDLNVYEFFSHYESVNHTVAKKRGTKAYKLKSEHPESETRCIVRHERSPVPKFCNWLWPDTKDFNGSIFDTSPTRTKMAECAIDAFAKYSLILFCPFRNSSNLTLNGSLFKNY